MILIIGLRHSPVKGLEPRKTGRSGRDSLLYSLLFCLRLVKGPDSTGKSREVMKMMKMMTLFLKVHIRLHFKEN
jgi:hypothetical protein